MSATMTTRNHSRPSRKHPLDYYYREGMELRPRLEAPTLSADLWLTPKSKQLFAPWISVDSPSYPVRGHPPLHHRRQPALLHRSPGHRLDSCISSQPGWRHTASFADDASGANTERPGLKTCAACRTHRRARGLPG